MRVDHTSEPDVKALFRRILRAHKRIDIVVDSVARNIASLGARCLFISVIGGKLDMAGGGDSRTAARLLAAGFDAVFEDTGELTAFRSLVRNLAIAAGVQIGAR